MFELSILHHLEQATLNPKFNRYQRGFIKEKSTIHNINDLFSIWRVIQADKRRNRRNSPAIVFFDFEKAYDMVPRQLLIKKLNEFDIPCNIIAIIKDMLDKFCLNYNGIKIKTEKGLVQGSTLSPLLFNLFINDLLNLLERWGIKTRAYADDTAWIWKNVQQWQEAIRIMKPWADENAMKINPTKSGILRILLKKSKIKKIQNELDIPEVESYCYLGIRINQTINPMEHILSLRSIEDKLIRRINILKPSLVSTKSRFIIFKTIIKAKFWYAAYVLWHYNQNYIKKWESIIYRILKRLFLIKGNVSKSSIFKTLQIEDIQEQTENTMKRLKGIKTEMHTSSRAIEQLSLKVIKLRIGWLFQKKRLVPKCNCSCILDSKHIIKEWPKTRIWRLKWNYRSRNTNGKSIFENLMSVEIPNENEQQLIELMNKATEELTETYLEY